MSADAETAHQIRGLIARAVQRSSNDNGGSQTANVEVHRHVERTGVEIISPFGFASRSPAGGEMLVLAVGGDQGDLAGLPTSSPDHRLGGLEEGEAAMHNLKGDRVHVKADGAIDSTSTLRIKDKVKTAVIEVLEDRIVIRIGEGAAAPRFVVRPSYVKMRQGAHWMVVQDSGIVCSVMPVVGPDPEPGV